MTNPRGSGTMTVRRFFANGRFFLNAIFLTVSLFICHELVPTANATTSAPMPVVVVSVEPLALLVREICDGICDVFTLIPRGGSEHGWQPKPKEMVRAKNSVASIAIGLDFDNLWFVKIGTDPKSILWLGPMLNPMTWWSDDLAGGVKPHHDEAPAKVPVKAPTKAANKAHEHEHEDEHGHEPVHGNLDPHIWVDAVRMSAAATVIAQHLSKALPASSASFQSRAKIISDRLAKLQLSVEAQRKTWRVRPVVMFHDMAGYFGRRFELPILSVASGSSGHDLSARMIADMSKRFGSSNVAAVVVERDGGAAKNLARELKATTRVIDFAAAKNYAKWDDWYLQVVNSWEEILKN